MTDQRKPLERLAGDDETIEAYVSGIPCLARIDDCIIVKPWRGSPQTCPSSDDYYGYQDIRFTLFDRRGYRATWLDARMTADEKDRIELAILERAQSRND